MSKRGKALGGKDQGIYEKILADGSKRYLVRIKYQKPNGKSGSKVETVNTLREARQLRKLGVSKRMVGGLSDKVTPRTRLADVVEQFLQSKRGRRSYGDIEWLLKGTHGVVASFGEDFDLRQIRDSDVVWFKREVLEKRSCIPTFKRRKKSRAVPDRDPRSGRQLSNRTKNSYLMYLRAVLRKAQKMGLITYIPEIEFYPVDNQRELKIDLETFAKLVSLMPEAPKPHRAMLLMELYTAQRWSDLAHMTRSQIRGPITAGSVLEYRSSKNRRGLIRIPLPQTLAVELETLSQHWTPDQELMFANPKTGKPYTGLKQSIATACRKLGIAPLEFYQFRHLSGTEYLRELRDPHLVAQILGHKNSQMVDQRYGHVVDRPHDGVSGLNRKIQAYLDQSTQEDQGGTLVVPASNKPTAHEPFGVVLP